MALLSPALNCLAKWSQLFVITMFVVCVSCYDVSAETYTPISLDTNYTFTHSGTDSWYSFELKKGQGISVELTTHFSSGNIDCYLYDSAIGRWSSVSNALSSKLTSLNAQSTGTYYLKVTGSGAGTYDLRIHNAWYNPGNNDSGRDFSSTLATAKYLVPGSSHSFNTTAGKDYYRFVAKKGAAVSVTLTHHFSSGSATIGLYDKYGFRFAEKGYVGVGYAGTMALSFTAPKDDVYFFTVYSTGGAIVGSYDLGGSGVEPDADSDGDGLPDGAEYYHGTDPHVADTNHNEINDPDELILGRNPATSKELSGSDLTNAISRYNAIPLKMNEVATGVATGSDIWHSIDLKKDQKVTFVLTSRFPSGISPVFTFDLLHTIDTSNKFITFTYEPFSWAGNTGWFDYTVPTDGTYYIKIPYSAASGTLGSYDVAVFSSWQNPGTLDTDRIFRTSENAGISNVPRIFSSSMYTARYLENRSYPFPTREGREYSRFRATGGVPVSITLSANLSAGIVQGNILDADGNKVTAQCSSGYSCTDTGYVGPKNLSQFTMTFTPAASGDYYYHVYPNGTTNGMYSLTATGIDPSGEADDHGNGTSDATVVSDNSQTAGKIQNELYTTYDEDFFTFTATRTGFYEIYTTGTVDTYGQVCDATGQTCVYDDDSGDYPNFMIRKIMTAGDVAYIGVSSQLASGGYTLHVVPPGLPTTAAGIYLFTPVYPSVDTQPSTIMQGGRVKRIYKASYNLLGQLYAATNQQFDYQVCEYTLPGTALCSEQIKSSTTSAEGYISFETDWVTEDPGTTVNRYIKFVNIDGTPNTLIENTTPPLFDVAIYARSLKEENSLTFGANIGVGVGEGVGVKVLGLGVRAELAKAGLLGEKELGATISFDTNEFGTAYRERKKTYDNVKLGFDVGYGEAVGVKIEGGGKAEFLGAKVTLASAGVSAKISTRQSRNDEFPEFFSSTETVQARAQANAFAGRLLNISGLLMPEDSSFSVRKSAAGYLLDKGGLQADYRKESSYEVKTTFSGELGGPSFEVKVGGVKLGELKTIGVSGDVVMSYNEGISLNPDDAYTTKRVELAYSNKISWPEYKIKIPVIPPEVSFNTSTKLVQGTGGKYTNDVTIKKGNIDQIKLSMTTDLKTTEMLGYFSNLQGVVENRISVYTTDPGYAQFLADNHMGVAVLAGFGLLGTAVNATLDFDLLNTDLLSVLEYTGTAGSWGFVNSPLEYYNSHTETWFTDFTLPLELEAGVYLELGAKVGVVRSTNQIQTKGVATVHGNFETEEYRLDDTYINSRKKSMGDIGAVYGKYVAEAFKSAVNKVQATLTTAWNYVGDLANDGINATKKVGDAFNWLNYKIHLATTKGIPSGQSMLAMQYPPDGGMTAQAVALAAGTAVPIGQSHFVNIQDPGGVDLQTFPAPITISLGYKLTDITAAGLAESDAAYLRIYRWDDTYGIWVYMGGTVNTSTQSVSIDITGKGSFVLAIDKLPPSVSNFVASNTTTTPTLTATIKDSLSGINTDSFSMTLDGTTVINSTNWQNHFNKTTGQFSYTPTTDLAGGTHTAVLNVSDSGGNLTQATLNFTVNALQPAISHTPPTGANAGSPILISASVPGTTAITEARVVYRLDNGSYKNLQLTVTGSTYAATIPSVDTNGKQISYYLYFRDANGYQVYSPALAPASSYTIVLTEGATRTLNITFDGLGGGAIQASGLVCANGGCTGTYAPGATVSLTPQADSSSLFGGWFGEACSVAGPCSVTMNANVNLTAIFHKQLYPLSLNFSGPGGGSVNSTPGGIACTTGSSTGCTGVFPAGSTVTLVSAPDIGSTFSALSGDCASTSGSCSLTMNGTKSVTATFAVKPATVRIEGTTAPYYMIGSVLDLITGTKSVYARDILFTEDIIMTSPATILLKGGYTDTGFTTKGANSYSIIDGRLTVRRGTLRMERVKLR